MTFFSSYVVPAAVSLAGLLVAVPAQAVTQMTVQEATAQGAYAHLFGTPADAKAAGRTIELRGQSVVRVTSGETVAFRSGTRIAAWNFTPRGDSTSVAINELLPAMWADSRVYVLIERSPVYSGN
ncbi:CzcE family metal-binding protein [Ralstonia soli]|uniref:CzcE family metal-binding protein n=1 Tax=Ralstonia soli TaxID=2953896 RepID=A0ABT1APX0_9RALS|nr:CzcE family metal-binding protein [Ralstonia soli]MCO5400453.1 CzcE family metal-binding protein [Ralstonia soli]